MIPKTSRTMDVYEKAGTSMRLLNTVVTEAVCDVSAVLSSTDTDSFLKAINKIEVICCRAEDNMFSDHPELSNEYLDVFYGSFNETPRNEVDKRIMDKARKMCDELFEGKQH